MALQPIQRGRSLDEQRVTRERQANLRRDLAPLERITGRPLALQTIKGNVQSLDVERAHLLSVCRFLRDQLGFHLLSSISGVDMLDHLEIIYHLRALSRTQLLQLRVRVDSQQPEVDSIVSVWPGANWLERETYDLFGIRFLGHPDLRRILLDDEFEGFPLLKSFQAMPPVLKDQATTQVDPNIAIAGEFQTQHYERVVGSKVSQGMEERLHPGTPTFGNTQEGVQKKANQQRTLPEGESPALPEGYSTEVPQ